MIYINLHGLPKGQIDEKLKNRTFKHRKHITATLAVRPELRRILFTIGDLAHDDTNTSVLDSAINRETSLPDYQLDKVLNELDSLGLIEILPKPSGVDFRLVNITSKGLQELRSVNADSSIGN